MSANAIETLRRGIESDSGEYGVQDEALRVVDAVEALLEAAKPVAQYDFAATQWIAGLEHDGHELRAIHAEDVENLKREVAALAAAVRRVETGQ